ncbi:MAG: MarR family transcriptional regulator [Pseudomonadota bacterium]
MKKPPNDIPQAGLPGDSVYFKVLAEIDMISHMSSLAFAKFLPDGITEAQFGVINRLMRLEAEETIGELAAAFQVTQPTMSSTVRRLEFKRFVELVPDPADRRIRRVRMTKVGMRVRNDTVALLEPFYTAFEAETPDVDWDACLAALMILRAYFERKRDKNV